MPIPKPRSGETEDNFMSRCMGNSIMVSEYPDNSQRAGICHASWDNKGKKKKLLRKIYDVLYILKANKYEKLAAKLANQMVNTWDESAKAAYKDALLQITSGKGALSQTDIDKILEDLNARLGPDLASNLTMPAKQFTGTAYILGQNEVLAEMGGSMAFDLADKKALSWMGKNTMYWIRSYFGDNISQEIARLGIQALKEGLTRESAGQLFGSFFDKYKNSESYWKGLANHVITRAREFGHCEAYIKAGVEYIRFVAVMDHRTSPICSEMNGKIMPVSWMQETRDNLINSTDPEEAKGIAPWLSNEQIETLVFGQPIEEIPKYLSVPPLHWHCRSRTVRSTAEAWDSQKIAQANFKSKLDQNLIEIKSVNPADHTDWQIVMNETHRIDLTPDQKLAFTAYKSTGYERINGSLRGSLDLTGTNKEEVEKFVKSMDDDFKLRLDNGLIVYRSAVIAELAQAVEANTLIGTQFVDYGFTSTSTMKDFAQGFYSKFAKDYVFFEIRLPKDSQVALMEAIYSRQEGEVLLPRGSKFQILKTEKVALETMSGNKIEYKKITAELVQ